jgi:hypothetical protein
VTWKLLPVLAFRALFILVVALLQRRHPQGVHMTAPTALTVHQLSDTPLANPADAASDNINGNSFPNTGATFVRVNNTGGSSATITFHPADPTLGPENLAVGGEAVSVAAAAIEWIGRRDITTFSRVCTFTTSASTLEVAVFEP